MIETTRSLARTQDTWKEFFEGESSQLCDCDKRQHANGTVGKVVNFGGVESLDEAKQLIDDLLMCQGEHGAAHDWQQGDTQSESACCRCGVCLDYMQGQTLVFSDTVCRTPWIEWKADLLSLPDEKLPTALGSAEYAWLTYHRGNRPKYVLLAELRAILRKISRRGLSRRSCYSAAPTRCVCLQCQSTGSSVVAN